MSKNMRNIFKSSSKKPKMQQVQVFHNVSIQSIKKIGLTNSLPYGRTYRKQENIKIISRWLFAETEWKYEFSFKLEENREIKKLKTT